MKRILPLLLVFCMMSCEYFNKKKVYSEDLLEDELKTFSWNEVDEYPSFALCDSTQGRSNKKYCFERTLLDFLNENLSQNNIIVTETVEDTVKLKLIIDNTGKLSIKTIEKKPITQSQIPQLDSLLRHSLDSLPKIYPAIKRSQQVTTQYQLPVIIKIE